MSDLLNSYKVVVAGPAQTLKGYVQRPEWPEILRSLGADDENPNSIRLRRQGSDAEEVVDLDKVKAIFFVRDFNGEVRHNDIRFHDHLPATESLWVRVGFDDGETIEGLINNTHDFVLSPGFLMSPADPLGNNWLIYVLKSNVIRFEVLGLRPKTKTLSQLEPQ
jgi:hypothetical protein